MGKVRPTLCLHHSTRNLGCCHKVKIAEGGKHEASYFGTPFNPSRLSQRRYVRVEMYRTVLRRRVSIPPLFYYFSQVWIDRESINWVSTATGVSAMLVYFGLRHFNWYIKSRGSTAFVPEALSVVILCTFISWACESSRQLSRVWAAYRQQRQNFIHTSKLI